MACHCKHCRKENKCSNKFCIFCGTSMIKNTQEEPKETTFLSIEDCYKVLELMHTSTNTELKYSYRRLAKLYHSDILKGKDLPLDIISFGEEKFKRISYAYEKIKKHRNI